MNKPIKISLILLVAIVISCKSNKSITSQDFQNETAHHQRIAVVPFKSTIKLRKKQKETISDEELKELEIAQGKEVQNAVESFLLGRNLRVRVQSQSVTNSKLKSNRINLEDILDTDVIKLCSILGVDAVVVGELETNQPMSEELARGLNAGKQIANSLGGAIGRSLSKGVKTTTNEGWCTLSLFESKHGDRLWTYKNDLEMGAGSRTQDIIAKLMKKGAKEFPYKK